MIELDHLVVAARSLQEGAEWIERQLGIAPVAGGKHAAMGTHNRLLGLGERTYLEVIAIDEAAAAPARPRWFALDTAPMRARLAMGPALIHWVVRSDDLDADVAKSDEPLDILSMTRGDFRWRIGVPPDGRLPANGSQPTLIQWEGEAHPAGRLPDSGCRLLRFSCTVDALSALIGTRGATRLLSSPRIRLAE